MKILLIFGGYHGKAETVQRLFQWGGASGGLAFGRGADKTQPRPKPATFAPPMAIESSLFSAARRMGYT